MDNNKLRPAIDLISFPLYRNIDNANDLFFTREDLIKNNLIADLNYVIVDKKYVEDNYGENFDILNNYSNNINSQWSFKLQKKKEPSLHTTIEYVLENTDEVIENIKNGKVYYIYNNNQNGKIELLKKGIYLVNNFLYYDPKKAARKVKSEISKTTPFLQNGRIRINAIKDICNVVRTSISVKKFKLEYNDLSPYNRSYCPFRLLERLITLSRLLKVSTYKKDIKYKQLVAGLDKAIEKEHKLNIKNKLTSLRNLINNK